MAKKHRNKNKHHKQHAVKPTTTLLPLGAMLCGLTFATALLAESSAEAIKATDKTTTEATTNKAEDKKTAVKTTENETTLQTVNVEDTKETAAESSYQGGTTKIGKLDQLPKDIPQSVTVVTNKLMEERNEFTFKEALRNVAGITFNAGEGGRIGDNITIRGYSAVGDIYLDGMRDSAQYNRETFNLEQIDVLRGSASMIFGRGSTGGVINQVSKQPLLTDRYIMNATVGSYDYQRATGDFNQQLDDTTAIRATVMDTKGDSFRDEVHFNRSGFAPTISFGIGAENQFTLSHYHLEEDNLPDFGIPYFDPDDMAGAAVNGPKKSRPLDVDRDTFYGVANADYEHNNTDITTATYTHQFSDESEVTTKLRTADYDRDLWAAAPRLPQDTNITNLTGTTPVTRGRQARGGNEDTVTSQTDFTTLFNVLGFENSLLFGNEYVHEKAERWGYTIGATFNCAGNPARLNPCTTVANPNSHPALPAGYQNVRRNAFNEYQGDSYAFYLQDIIGLTEHWKLMLGGRWDHFSADYERPAPNGPLDRTDVVNSWRTGLMYQPDDMTTYYIARGSSFNPSAELYQLDASTDQTPPERNYNSEIGAKWELFEGDLSLRTSISRTEKTDERNTDLTAPAGLVLAGRRHTDSFEVEAVGRPTQNWEMFVTGAYMEANIDEHGNTNILNVTVSDEDNEPINTPHYTYSVWNTYNLGHGWKVGAGIDGVGQRYANQTNLAVVPSYSRWDTMVSYNQKDYNVRMNLLNVFDKEYYDSVYTGHVVPGQARTLQVTFEYKI